jgi:surface antigen
MSSFLQRFYNFHGLRMLTLQSSRRPSFAIPGAYCSDGQKGAFLLDWVEAFATRRCGQKEERAMRRLVLIAAICAAIGGGFGAPAYAGDETILGTLGGAALGGFVGAQFGHGAGNLAATGLGAFTGAIIGNSFGRSLEYSRRPYSGGGYSGYGYSYSPYYAPGYYYEPNYVAPYAPPPPRVIYVQPNVFEYRAREPAYVEGGYVGASSAPAYTPSSSSYCREYTQQIRIGNQIQESYGTACLQPDGSWRVER